jgi:recombination protein RecA
MERLELDERFEPPKTFPTGSTLLDLALDGGWALARTINLVGDTQSFKTGLCISACAEFSRLYGVENIRFNECDDPAFDEVRAQTIGLPEGLDVVHSLTAEEWVKDLEDFLAKRDNQNQPCLYIMDSYDALTDEEELKRDIEKGSYKTDKVKRLTDLLRMRSTYMEQAKCTLLIVSQIRDNFDVSYGNTKRRAGGNAIRFYPSQEVWLAVEGQLQRVISGSRYTYGIRVIASVRKNRLGRPFKKVRFPLIFNYGVDDEIAMIEYLKDHEVKANTLGLTMGLDRYKDEISDARHARDREAIRQMASELKKATIAKWNEIEEKLAPPMSKYE